jgi:hypothetical protein
LRSIATNRAEGELGEAKSRFGGNKSKKLRSPALRGKLRDEPIRQLAGGELGEAKSRIGGVNSEQ